MKLLRTFSGWADSRRGKVIMTLVMGLLTAHQVMFLLSEHGRNTSLATQAFAALSLTWCGHYVIDNLLSMLRWIYSKENTDADFFVNVDGEYVLKLEGDRSLEMAVAKFPDEWGHGAGHTYVIVRDQQTSGWGGKKRERKKAKESVTEKHSVLKPRPVTEGSNQ